MNRNDLFQAALLYHQQGDLEEAIRLYEKALHYQPSPDAYANLGVALRLKGYLEAALIAYQRALALAPEHIPSLSNLGGVYRALGQLDQAQSILEQTIQLNPSHAASYYNLGLVWMDAQAPEKAIACFEKAIALEPNRVDAPFDRAVSILQTGNLLQGFEAYECRFAYEKRLVRPHTQPPWEGTPLFPAQTLLLYTEQGFGDTLQFIRFVSLIEKQAGSRIILECPDNLRRLMETVPQLDQVIVTGEPLPAFDVHASLLSLPHLFKTTLESIPAKVPYLKAPSAKRFSLEQTVKKLKVGVVWASGHTDVGVRCRTISLKHWAPVLAYEKAQFYSLQKGSQAQELQDLRFDSLMQDIGAEIHDFADTANVLEELDLLISADTAIVHLAGAMNKPVWVLLPSGSEWRWLLNCSDSPWYPSMRLFRQAIHQKWDELLSEVAHALKSIDLR